jgi:hypothetical protein
MLDELSEYVSADISDFGGHHDGSVVDAMFAKIRRWLKVGLQ